MLTSKVPENQGFTFHNPTKIVFGRNALEKIGDELAHDGIKRVLLLAGEGSIKKNGVYDRVIASLQKKNIGHVESWGVVANPVVEKCREAIAMCKDPKLGIQAIVAVGGGSVIDSAKAIGAGATVNTDLWEIVESKKYPETMMPVYSVLTISATASESNNGAVISNRALNKKYPSFYKNPTCAFIDPSVQETLPWRQVMCGAVDTLSHLMEQYFSADGSQETTMCIDLALMQSVIACIDELQKDPKNFNARSSFCWASTLALNGLPQLGLCGDWNVHWIEHPISGIFPQVAHAEGLAVVTLAYIPYLYARAQVEAAAKKNTLLARLVTTIERWAQQIWGAKTVDEALLKFYRKLRQWNAPCSLEDLKISQNDIPKIAKVYIEGTWRSSSFPLTEQDVFNILSTSVPLCSKWAAAK